MKPPIQLRLVYSLTVIFIAFVAVQMGLLLTRQWSGNWTQASAAIYIACDLLIAYMLLRAIWRITAQAYLSRRWLKRFRAAQHNKLTRQLAYKYRSWGTEIIVVKDASFVALTIGMRRPKIVISTGVLDRFSDEEARAILLHEWHHCRNYDNVKMFLTTLLTDAFGYWPIVKPVSRYYETWTELLADRFAIRQMGTELHLGSVLLKVAKLGKLEQQRRTATVYFAHAMTMQYRMMQVLEPSQTVKVPIAWLRPLLVSCTLLLLLMVGGDS